MKITEERLKDFKWPQAENIYFWIHMCFVKKFLHWFIKIIVLIINTYIVFIQILHQEVNKYPSML
jgi:hypothetical protein